MTQIFNLESWKEAVHAAALPVDGKDEAVSLRARPVPSIRPELADLSFYRVIEVRGSEAAEFLQGQFCNDFSEITPARAQLTGYCNPKGRLLALPLASASLNGFYLLIPTTLCDAFVKRLTMYVLRADVQLKVREDLICTGITADKEGSPGEGLNDFEALPREALETATLADKQLIRWYDDSSDQAVRARFLFIAPIADQLRLWNNPAGYDRVTSANWRLADIRAGLPSLTQATSEAFVPQMLNMQLINALSFTKGCYPGQEIVARMQYLGKLKRQMQLYSFTADDALPQAGDSLSCASDSDAGTVVSAIADENGTGSLLAVIKIALADEALSVKGLRLSREVLPYATGDEPVGDQESA